jgi:hypothetical protein
MQSEGYLMKSIMACAAAAFLALGAASADAALIAGSDGPFTINQNGSQGYGVSLPDGAAGDAFTADFLFSTTGGPNGGSTAIECYVGCANIDFDTIQLFARNGANQPVGASLADGLVQVVAGTIDIGSLAFANLVPGSYLVRTAGTFLASGNASIGGTVTVTPIPAAVLLFGSALAGLGAVHARRRQAGEGAPAAV